MRRFLTYRLRIPGIFVLGLLILPLQAEPLQAEPLQAEPVQAEDPPPQPPSASAEKARLLEKLRQTRRGKPYSQPLDVHKVRPGVTYEKRNELIEEAQRFKEKDYRGTFQDTTNPPAKGIKLLEGAEDLQAPDPEEDQDRSWLIPKNWDQDQEKDRLRKAWEEEHGPLRDDPRNPEDSDREGGSLFERGKKQTDDWKKEDLEEEDFSSEDQMDDILSIFSEEEEDTLGTAREPNTSKDTLEPAIPDSALQDQPGSGDALDQLRQEPTADQQHRNQGDSRLERASSDYRNRGAGHRGAGHRGAGHRGAGHRVSGETTMDPYGSTTEGPALSRTQELLGRIARPEREQRERERTALPNMERLLPKRPRGAISSLSEETDRILGRNRNADAAKPDAAGTQSNDPRFRTRLQGLSAGSGTQGYQPSLQLNSTPLRPLTLSPPAVEVRRPTVPRMADSLPGAATPRLGSAPPKQLKPAATVRPRLPGLNPDRYRLRSRLGDKNSAF